jgi:hypothetical protein
MTEPVKLATALAPEGEDDMVKLTAGANVICLKPEVLRPGAFRPERH